jgi:hypothetical protein
MNFRRPGWRPTKIHAGHQLFSSATEADENKTQLFSWPTGADENKTQIFPSATEADVNIQPTTYFRRPWGSRRK